MDYCPSDCIYETKFMVKFVEFQIFEVLWKKAFNPVTDWGSKLEFLDIVKSNGIITDHASLPESAYMPNTVAHSPIDMQCMCLQSQFKMRVNWNLLFSFKKS